MSTLPFIGRAGELALVEQLLAREGTVIALCVGGEGGIGKTSLLREIARRHPSSSRLACSNILDFDAPTLRVPGNLRPEIADQLGQVCFHDYLRQLQDYHRMQMASVSYERLGQEMELVEAAFDRCYHDLARQRRVLLLMDTLEDVQDGPVWADVVSVIRRATNTLFVLSGRRAEEAHAALRPILGEEATHLIIIQPFSSDEAAEYIRAKQEELQVSLPPDLAERLIQATNKKPILLDLAAEWVARDVPMPWLIEHPAGELATMPDQRRKEFEAALVRSIGELRGPLDEMVLHMAYAYPLDEEIMVRLLTIEAEAMPDLRRELDRLAFVKPMPDGSYMLHDEMRRMVNEYIWDTIDPRATRRAQISRQMAPYLRQKANRIARRLAAMEKAETEEQQNLDDFLARDVLQRQYWVVREQQLFHTLRADLRQGYRLFVRTFEEATQAYYLPARATFLDAITPFLDQLTGGQRYEVEIRRVRYLLDADRLQDIIQAQALLDDLMATYADDDRREVDMLSRLANCAIKSGYPPRAITHLRHALDICQRRNLPWIGTMENALGWAYRLMGQQEQALEYYEAALSHSQDDSTIAWTYNNIGYVECLRGEYEVGVRYCEHALSMWEEMGRRREAAITHHTLGDIHRYWGRYDQAIAFFNQALEFFEPHHDHTWLARTYALRGAVRRMQDDFDGALADLNLALQQNALTEAPYATHVLGCVYWNMGNLDEALRLFARSDDLARQIFDIRSRINNLVGAAEIHLLRWEQNHNEPDRRQILDNHAALLELVRQGYQFPHHVGRMNRVLGDLAYAEGRFDDALRHYAEAFALLGGRYAGYGRRTFRDELGALEKNIDALPPQQAIEWCDELEAYWSDPQRDIQRREELLSACRIHRTRARRRL